MQFLVRTVNKMAPDFPAAERERLVAEEQEKSKSLSESGKLIGFWKVPLRSETVTLWEVSGPDELHAIFSSLPAAKWARATATALIPRDLQAHGKDAPNKIA